jgi:hypothetical protein
MDIFFSAMDICYPRSTFITYFIKPLNILITTVILKMIISIYKNTFIAFLIIWKLKELRNIFNNSLKFL